MMGTKRKKRKSKSIYIDKWRDDGNEEKLEKEKVE